MVLGHFAIHINGEGELVLKNTIQKGVLGCAILLFSIDLAFFSKELAITVGGLGLAIVILGLAQDHK
ncbi:hypothetical protein M2140_001473 [Clostridiales Family XIII bacterium PM5-7]